jgi:hypothetical protein
MHPGCQFTVGPVSSRHGRIYLLPGFQIVQGQGDNRRPGDDIEFTGEQGLFKLGLANGQIN